ncbi:MAG: YihY/virulence factor BrkB family protein [Thermoleophilia bacterium]|nr:YihY/virulence factor BrkB family protein [Thermoleophilia bacterium]
MNLDVVKSAAKRAKAAEVPDRAAALAYYGFLAVPSVLLLVLGALGIFSSPDQIGRILDKGKDVMPPEAITLLKDSVGRQAGNAGGGVLLVLVGLVLAMWSGSGAMNAMMRAMNGVYGVKETRDFVKQRVTAVAMLAWALLAVVLVVGLLILGPVLSRWLGDAVGNRGVTSALWWTLQWPLLVIGVMASFAGMLLLGPNRPNSRWRLRSRGALIATVLWIIVSAAFALYASRLGSFNAAWGSLSVVVVTLMWLWLSSMVLLFGAALDAEEEGAPPPTP